MITTFNVATLLSDTDMHSTGFPQFPMNVHEGLKDGPQPSFNLSILAQSDLNSCTTDYVLAVLGFSTSQKG